MSTQKTKRNRKHEKNDLDMTHAVTLLCSGIGGNACDFVLQMSGRFCNDFIVTKEVVSVKQKKCETSQAYMHSI